MRLLVSIFVAAICHIGLLFLQVSRVEEVPPQLAGSRTVCLTFSASQPVAESTDFSEEKQEVEEEKSAKPDIPDLATELLPLPEKPQKVTNRITQRNIKKTVTQQVKDPSQEKAAMVQKRSPEQKRPVALNPPTTSSESASLGKEVEVKATPLYRQNKQPDYPSLARRRGWQGRVIVAVEVLKTGAVGSVRIHKSSGYAILDESALKAVSRWLFQPGKRKGQPVDMDVVVPIRFTLRGK